MLKQRSTTNVQSVCVNIEKVGKVTISFSKKNKKKSTLNGKKIAQPRKRRTSEMLYVTKIYVPFLESKLLFTLTKNG